MKKYLKHIILLIAFLSYAAPSHAALGYYASITIDHTQAGSSDATNFPYLFIGNVALKTIGNGGSYVQQTDADDIQFFSDSGLTTLLKYELVVYDATTGLGEWWIKIPTLSHTSDTVIYVGVGDAGATNNSDPTNVWDSNYKAVWHLKDGSTLSGADSTSNTNTLTINSTASAGTGQIDGGATLSGLTNVPLIRSNISSTPAGFTLSMWAKRDGVQIGDFGLIGSWSNNGYMLYCASSSSACRAYGNGTNIAGTSTPFSSTGVWHFLAGTWNGSTLAIYIDGAQENTTSFSGPLSSSGVNFDIGAYQDDNSRNFNGTVDEGRLSIIARSSDWLTAEYNNQKSSSTMTTLSSFSAVGGGGGSTPSILGAIGAGR